MVNFSLGGGFGGGVGNGFGNSFGYGGYGGYGGKFQSVNSSKAVNLVALP